MTRRPDGAAWITAATIAAHDARTGRFSAFRYALVASLLIHGAALFVTQRAAPGRPVAPTPALRLRLMPAPTLTEPVAESKPVSFERAKAARNPSQGVAPRAKGELRNQARQITTSPSLSAPASEPGAEVPPSGPHFDMDELRRQARSLGTSSEHRGPSVVPTPVPVPDDSDRPVLQALAKRLGHPEDGFREETLTDGTRVVRFRDGVCLRVPRHLPIGAENPIGPTIIVPMTCPRSR